LGKINVYDKIMIENQKKVKMWKSKKFYTNLEGAPSKNCLQMEFTVCRVFTVCDAYRYFIGQA